MREEIRSLYSEDHPKAEIISIGYELLIGKTVNTNATWIARKLTFYGFRVQRITVIGDSLEEISGALKEALSRGPKVIITTGGLGPTFDDMTSKAIAVALELEWTLNEKALEEVKRKYEKMGLELNEVRKKMAMMPAGAIPLHNPVGTAPGIFLKYHDVYLFALPGVPAEMKGIFEEEVEPRIKEIAPKLRFYQKYLYVGGIPESSAAPALEEVMKRVPRVYIKSHPHGSEEESKIEYHIQCYAENSEKAKELVEKACSLLKEKIKKLGGKIIEELRGNSSMRTYS